MNKDTIEIDDVEARCTVRLDKDEVLNALELEDVLEHLEATGELGDAAMCYLHKLEDEDGGEELVMEFLRNHVPYVFPPTEQKEALNPAAYFLRTINAGAITAFVPGDRPCELQQALGFMVFLSRQEQVQLQMFPGTPEDTGQLLVKDAKTALDIARLLHLGRIQQELLRQQAAAATAASSKTDGVEVTP